MIKLQLSEENQSSVTAPNVDDRYKNVKKTHHWNINTLIEAKRSESKVILKYLSYEQLKKKIRLFKIKCINNCIGQILFNRGNELTYHIFYCNKK